MLSANIGKNAAIRQIMKERQGKKMTAQHPELQLDESSTCNNSQKENLCAARTSPLYPSGLPHTVTFDDDAGGAKADFRATEILYCRNQMQWIDDEQAAANDSLSSSHWVLMEHGLDNNVEMPEWKGPQSESILLQLMGTSLMTLSSSPERTDSNGLSEGSDDGTPDEAEPNVSWPDDDLGGQTLETPLREGDRIIASKHFETRGFNESDEQTNFSMSSFPPSTDDEAAAKSAPNGSPFSTFRQNSTSIALHETQVYIQKIQALEEQLAQAQRHGAEFRSEPEQWQGATTTPRILHRTPAAGSTFTSSNLRGLLTPRTALSSTTSLLPESLWERNKTLVTEIRFADQTCVELAGQKAALERQVAALQQQRNESRAANKSLHLQVVEALRENVVSKAEVASLQQRLSERQNSETLGREGLISEPLESRQLNITLEPAGSCQPNGIRQTAVEPKGLVNGLVHRHTQDVALDLDSEEKKCLETDLEEAREQLSSLRDELVENYESSCGAAAFLEAQISVLASELDCCREALEASRLAEEVAKQQLAELRIQTESWRPQQNEMMEQKKDEPSCTAEHVGRAVSDIEDIAKHLAERVASRIGLLEDRLNSCNTSVKYLVDQLVFSDDDNDGHTDSVDEAAESVSDDGEETKHSGSEESAFNATFSGRNQSADLALMEEARASMHDVRKDQARRGPTSSDVDDDSRTTTPSKNTSDRLSSFDGMSHVLIDDVSILSTSISHSGNCGSNNENFLQHLQWLASPNSMLSPSPIDDQSTPALDAGAQEPQISVSSVCNHLTSKKECNDDDDDVGEIVEARKRTVSADLSVRSCELSLLERTTKWTEAELELVRQERDSLANQLELIVSVVGPDATKNGASFLERLHDLHAKHNNNSPKLSNALEHIAQLQASATDAASESEPGLRCRLVTLEAEKHVVNDELKSTRQALADGHLALTEAMEQVTRLQSSIVPLSEAAVERDLLRDQLKSLKAEGNKVSLEMEVKVNELKEAQTQIEMLQTESNKRGILRVRFESLQREMEVADDKLRQKSVFPRKIKHETKALQPRIRDELDLKLEQLVSLREEKQNQELEMEKVSAALDAARSTNVQQLADFQTTLKELDDRNLAAFHELKVTRIDRDALIEKHGVVSQKLKSLEEAHRLAISELEDKDAAIREAERSGCQGAAECRIASEVVAAELEKTKVALATLATAEEARKLEDELRFQSESEADVQAAKLVEDYRARMVSLERSLLEANEFLQRGNNETAALRATNESLTARCARLREYIRKLSKKCDEWETFHERELSVRQHLKVAHERTRKKASELAARCQQRDQVRYPYAPQSQHDDDALKVRVSFSISNSSILGRSGKCSIWR